MARERRLILVRGDAEQTRVEVEAMVAALADEAVLWVAPDPASRPFVHARPGALGERLGQAFDVVVLDAHAGFDADVLGQAHGLVWGGGALVVRLGPEDRPPPPDARLAAYPHVAADVGRRSYALVEDALRRGADPTPERLTAADHRTIGTAEQARVVEQLVASWARAEPSRIAVLADRGRGKSSALGLALRAFGERSARAGALLITAGSEAAAAEVSRSCADAARFVPLRELLASPREAAVIVVDEAAQLPVALLRRLVLAHPDTHLAFATTTHGYEGTGRGFSLRFSTWLRAHEANVEQLELREPIRWAADDPLERTIFAALLLDAEPAGIEPDADPERVRILTLDRDALARDRPRLRELFGLLIHAHYRTTPGDLQRLLDAPNLAVHAAILDERIVGATLVAAEGGLSPALTDAVVSGRTRLRAHGLADVIVAHLGHPEAGSLLMRRSVRIAVHPALRRRGVARRLVEHVHACAGPEVELFGTLFGATAALIGFRRRLGYEVVRISASRGARTGEPSVMMLRPVSAAARRLVDALRHELARELEVQLELLQADDALALDPALVAALRRDLPSPRPYTAAEQRALTESYAHGPRTFESVATAVRGFLESADLDVLPPTLRAVVEGRALGLHGWARVTRDAGLASVPLAMRALRRALRALLAADSSG